MLSKLRFLTICASLIHGKGDSSLEKYTDGYGNFKDIGCEKHITECQPWSTFFEMENDELVTIPCDVCISMGEYIDDEEIRCYEGIDVLGTLYIPEGSILTITTKFITVQGKLSIHTQEIPNGVADVKINMIGNGDYHFYPTNVNAHACYNEEEGTDYCNVGEKAIIVAGGVLDIKAFPDPCPTWVNLVDNILANPIVPNPYAKNAVPPHRCDRFPLNEYFNGVDVIGWNGGPGIIPVITNVDSHDGSSYLKITKRRRSWQGATIDLKEYSISECITKDTVYLLSMKVRLQKSSGASLCSEYGESCIEIMFNSMDINNKGFWKTLYRQPVGSAVPDGQWFSLYGEIEFSSSMLVKEHLFHSFTINGPEPAVDISVDDVMLELPEMNYPHYTEQCKTMAVSYANGDAEHSPTHSYPMKIAANTEAYLEIGTEANHNRFFKVKSRLSEYASVEVPLNPKCITENAYYKVTAKIWLQSEIPHRVDIALKRDAYTQSNSQGVMIRTAEKCPDSSVDSGWIECSSTFVLGSEYVGSKSWSTLFIANNDTTSELWVDDIIVTLVRTPVNKLVVDSSVLGCWDVGSDVLVTSSSIKYEEDTITSMISSIAPYGRDKAILSLYPFAQWHTSQIDDYKSAAEVALLSRKVLFFSEEAVNNNGFHLMILQSPNISQVIQGVEFKGGGQMGKMWRYPIYFRLGSNSTGSIVAKNTIRDSYQRCIVLQGTNNVTISWNIAYNSYGHCYMTQDGSEEFNLFEHNLGSVTKKMPIEKVLSFAESDNTPATFRITNPRNYFLNNVAAGSDGTGFWYHLPSKVEGPSLKSIKNYKLNPSEYVFGYNEGTVVHSNYGEGFKLYPNGYFPDTEVVLKGLRSYRNKGDGLLLHNTINIAVEDSYFADNRRSIDIDKKADGIRINNSHFLGFSKHFFMLTADSNLFTHCPAFRPLLGIQLHPFLRFRDSKGYKIENNVFERFSGFEYEQHISGCVNSTAIHIDPEKRDTPPHFDGYGLFTNNSFDIGVPTRDKFDACLNAESGYKDMYFFDQTGDLNPVNHGTPGFIVSNSTNMTAFLKDQICHEMTKGCALYCENTCFRTIHFALPMSHLYKEVKLQVTHVENNVSFDFHSYFQYLTYNTDVASADRGMDSSVANYNYVRRRYFSPSLPFGNYTFKFLLTGNETFMPASIEKFWHHVPDCSPYITNEMIFVESQIDNALCTDLIKNSGFNKDENKFEYWQQTGGDLQLTQQGFNSFRSIVSFERNSFWDGPGQFLDTRCLVENDKYEVIGRFRLQHDITNKFLSCDPENSQKYFSARGCPQVTIRTRTLVGDELKDDVETMFQLPVAQVFHSTSKDHWSTIYGIFEVTPEMANATSVYIFIEKVLAGLKILLDDFHVTKIQNNLEAGMSGCSDRSFNRDLEDGNTGYWSVVGDAGISITSPGYNSLYAIRTTYRKSHMASMATLIKPRCFIHGHAYEISAMVMLEKNGKPWTCLPGADWGPWNKKQPCPTLQLIPDSNGYTSIDVGRVAVQVWDPNIWNAIVGYFIAGDTYTNSLSVLASFGKFNEDVDIIVDDLSIKPLEHYSCSLNMLYNGDTEYGDVRNWETFYSGFLRVWANGLDGTKALSYHARKFNHDGVGMYLERDCLQVNATYKVSAQVKLYERELSDDGFSYKDDTYFMPYKCSLDCPDIVIAHQNKGSFPTFTVIGSIDDKWKYDEWNTLSGTFMFQEKQLSADDIWISIQNAESYIIIVVDNFRLYRETEL